MLIFQNILSVSNINSFSTFLTYFSQGPKQKDEAYNMYFFSSIFVLIKVQRLKWKAVSKLQNGVQEWNIFSFVLLY